MALADEILAADDCDLLDLPVEKWGKKIYLRSLSGAERNIVVKLSSGDVDMFQRKVLQFGIADAQGKPIFGDKQIAGLMAKNGKLLEEIAVAILEHNGLKGDAVDKEKKS
jgi:hypothetical protein